MRRIAKKATPTAKIKATTQQALRTIHYDLKKIVIQIPTLMKIEIGRNAQDAVVPEKYECLVVIKIL